MCLGYQCYSSAIKEGYITNRLIRKLQIKLQQGLHQIFNSISIEDFQEIPSKSEIVLKIKNKEVKIYLYIEEYTTFPQNSQKITAQVQLPSTQVQLKEILKWEKGTYIPLAFTASPIAEIVSDNKIITQATLGQKNSKIAIKFIKR